MRIITFGHNDWWVWSRQGFCTRNAALAREFARREDVCELLIVDSPRYRGRTHRPVEARRDETTTVAPGVVAVRYGYSLPLPATWGPGRRLNERLAAPVLERRLGPAAHCDPTVVWVADPRMVEAALAVPHDLFVFDAIDDWREHAWAGRDVVRRGYELVSRRADVVFAVHPHLLEILQPAGRAEVVFNAVAAESWVTAEAAAELASLPRPLVGYAGMIQRRVDLSLLAAVARLLPKTQFILVGHVTASCRTELGGLAGNVKLIGERPYREVPGLIAACDACIVPHVPGGLTASMDPLKLYEYLAAAKPVVSTVASPNPALADVVDVVVGAQAFAHALESAIEDDEDERRMRRLAAVAEQTWRARADRMLAVVSEELGDSGGRRS